MLSILLATAISFAAVEYQQPLTAPVEVKVKPGRSKKLVASTDPKIEGFAWDVASEDADLWDSESGRYAIFSSPTPGRYLVSCWACVGGRVQRAGWWLVIVGDGPIPPVPPVPPDPKPPVPPIPPVPPVDPLAAKLKAAFAADPGQSAIKTAQLAQLIGLYQSMADHAQTDKTIKTMGELKADLVKTASKLLLPSELMECRKLIAGEVQAALGVDDVPFDDPARARAVAVFTRISKALESVK